MRINKQWFFLLLIIENIYGFFYSDSYKKSSINLLFKDIAFTGRNLDRQWEIHKENFKGQWKGNHYWYNKNNLTFPFSINNNSYKINYIDNENAIYTRSDSKTFIITKTNYNNKGNAFMFPSINNNGGVGGQSSRILNYYLSNNNNFIQEINFFYKKRREMINIIYKYNNNKIRLDKIGIANLIEYNEHNNEIDLLKINDIELLLYLIHDWKGDYLSFSPYKPLNEKKQKINRINLKPFLRKTNRICKIFNNNIIISIPNIIEEFKDFTMVFGCLHSPFLYKQLTVYYDNDGVLTSWELIEFKPF